MSITQSMANAVSGLTATARMAEITSSNLSNVMTDGYGRRVVDLSAQQAGGRGAGVQVDGISRIVDRSVLSERRLAEAQVGFDQARSTSLGRLETAIGRSTILPVLPGGSRRWRRRFRRRRATRRTTCSLKTCWDDCRTWPAR